MMQPNIRPAHEFAKQFGVKSLIYGPPGGGKTPLVTTAPAPLIMLIEPGALSLRKSDIPAHAVLDTDPVKAAQYLDAMFEWYKGSVEAQKYQTWIFDSVTQMAEIYLARAIIQVKDGRAVYGKMADDVLKWTNFLYYSREKHIVLLAKQQISTADNKARPLFPGKELPAAIPHLYDEILQLALHNVPGVGELKSLRTAESFSAAARDRSGVLAEFEPADLTYLFNKIMKG